MITPEIIYGAYPRKIAKLKALAAIKKALRTKKPDFLLDKVQTYATMIKWQSREFIPYPATWFNQGHYDDDIIEWEQPAANGSPAKTTSTWELKAQIQVIEERIKEAERNGHENAFGLEFSDPKHRAEYFNLKRERKKLQDQIYSKL